MSQSSPPPLGYRSSGSPDPPVAHPFFLGLIIGSILSGLTWILWWKAAGKDISSGLIWILYAVPSIKLVVVVVCLSKIQWRRFGAGLLTSIAIGFMIFFGLCAATVLKGI